MNPSLTPLLVLLAITAGCEPLQDGGAWNTPAKDAVLQQVTLEGEILSGSPAEDAEPTPEASAAVALPFDASTPAPPAVEPAVEPAPSSAADTEPVAAMPSDLDLAAMPPEERALFERLLAGEAPPADDTGVASLADPPRSDQDALAALDRVAADPTTSAARSSALLESLGLPPCEPERGSAALSTTRIEELSIVQLSEGAALLKTPGGATFSITQGSTVGPTGARVVAIRVAEVVLAEIQFGMDGEPVIVQRSIKLPALR